MQNLVRAALRCARDPSGAAGGELAILAAFFAFGFLVAINLLGARLASTLSHLSAAMPNVFN